MKIKFVKDHDHKPVPAVTVAFRKGHETSELPRKAAQKLIDDKIAIAVPQPTSKEK